MARAVAAKGYADATIGDIVREASVSRRTFYEYFDTKAECLIALYEAASHNALKVLRSSLDAAQPWPEHAVEQALAAYFGCLAQNPVLLRTLFIEILGLGAPGLAARRRVNQSIADFMMAAVQANPAADPGKRLSPQMATAVLGGINELVLHLIEQDQVERLGELVKPAAELVHAVLQA